MLPSKISIDRWRFPFKTLLGLLVFAVVCVGAGAASAQGGPNHGWGPDFWQPGWMQRDMWGPQSMRPDMRAPMQRHWTYMHVGIPADYEGQRSTAKTTPSNIAEGGNLYVEQCASCHGKEGRGDGEAGKSLTPSPALLAFMIQRPIAVDEYLLWTISEGGEQFGTDMPAFKDVLDRDLIWKIVTYMRSGFPKTANEKK